LAGSRSVYRLATNGSPKEAQNQIRPQPATFARFFTFQQFVGLQKLQFSSLASRGLQQLRLLQRQTGFENQN
jgi:hypothetical protein